MGACVSGLVAPDQQHQDFASFEPNAGSLVLLGTQSAGSNSPTLFLCRDRASGWHWFDAVGYFVESESGTWDVVLAGILPCTATAGAEQKGRPVRVPWVDLVRTPGLHHIAVARQPAFNTSELIALQSYTRTVLKHTGVCRRVHMIAQRGSKVLLAELIAEMLVAVGRMQKTAGLDEYRGAGKVWRMPTLAFLEGLPVPVQRTSLVPSPDRTPRDSITLTQPEMPARRSEPGPTTDRASDSAQQQRQLSGRRDPPASSRTSSTAAHPAGPPAAAAQAALTAQPVSITRTQRSLSGRSSGEPTLTIPSDSNLQGATSGSTHDLAVSVTTPNIQTSPFYLQYNSQNGGTTADKHSATPLSKVQSPVATTPSQQAMGATQSQTPLGSKPLLIPLRSPKYPPTPVISAAGMAQSPQAASEASAVVAAAGAGDRDVVARGAVPAKAVASSLEVQPGRLSDRGEVGSGGAGSSPPRQNRWSVSVSGLSAPLLGAFRVARSTA